MLEKILEKWDAILLNIKEEHDVTDVSNILGILLKSKK